MPLPTLQLASVSTVHRALGDCPRIASDLPLDVVVERIVLPSGCRWFPVVEDDRALCLLTLHRIKQVPRKAWPTTRVEQAMIPKDERKTVRPIALSCARDDDPALAPRR
jgi:hypothetical protein